MASETRTEEHLRCDKRMKSRTLDPLLGKEMLYHRATSQLPLRRCRFGERMMHYEGKVDPNLGTQNSETRGAKKKSCG